MMGKSGNSLELVSFDVDKTLVYAREVGFYLLFFSVARSKFLEIIMISGTYDLATLIKYLAHLTEL